MNQNLQTAIAETINELFQIDVVPELSRPESEFGDLSTNVPMQIAKQLNKSPRDIAEIITKRLRDDELVMSAEVAGPGFINIRVSDQSLLDSWTLDIPQTLRHQSVVVEYSDPNPFKVLHAGHLYTSVIGDAIANLTELAGATVHRVNYGGDVGMHVAKTLLSVFEEIGLAGREKLDGIDTDKRADWMAGHYVEGTKAYDSDAGSKTDIMLLNKHIYEVWSDESNELPDTIELSSISKEIFSHEYVKTVYLLLREWSYDYFNDFYARIGSHFEKFYPESQTTARGLKEVRAQIGEVFSDSQGAVVFAGEAFGLHTRVFINSEGLPTYETKEVGLIFNKYEDYHFDRSIIITANEQTEYMKVVLKAIEQFAPELALATTHLTHGMVKLAGNVKMSSRKGNFLRAVDVLDAARDANTQMNHEADERVSLGAVKYSFLRQRTGGDIVYDPTESVSLVGNSGPYLQYAYVRAHSIVSKSSVMASGEDVTLDANERLLALKLTEYQEVLSLAVSELRPHYVCTYLYELAQVFNRFYENSRIIGDSREAPRLFLVKRYAETIKTGLGLLNIAVPDKL